MAATDPDLDWKTIQDLAHRLHLQIARDEPPNTIVAVARGGLIPATIIAHLIKIDDVRVAYARHTSSDFAHSPMLPELILRNTASVGDLTGRDVLLVDDIVTSGATISGVSRMIKANGAAKVRTAALVWKGGCAEPGRISGELCPDYWAVCCGGWVTFPWEVR
ncbi:MULTISPECIES: phosphoribosyltransferase [unclassified Streptomyces]|uniref:phosphoribosyltransferase n=1 Tax=unclassified Streptomyces TaxID=2593676 RepID=UPI00380354FA